MKIGKLYCSNLSLRNSIILLLNNQIIGQMI